MALDPVPEGQDLAYAQAQALRRNWWLLLIVGIVSVLAGVFVLVYPWTLSSVAVFVGVLLIVRGVLLALTPPLARARGWNVALGIVNLLFGIAVLIWPAATLVVLATLFGVWLVASGLFDIVASISVRRAAGSWWLVLLRGLIAVPLGVIALVSPALAIEVLVAVIGIWAVLVGIVEIVASFRARRLPPPAPPRPSEEAVAEAERILREPSSEAPELEERERAHRP
ncbi:MAG: HdeD family acid-resistance protein [Anaerolineae bacterium]